MECTASLRRELLVHSAGGGDRGGSRRGGLSRAWKRETPRMESRISSLSD